MSNSPDDYSASSSPSSSQDYVSSASTMANVKTEPVASSQQQNKRPDNSPLFMVFDSKTLERRSPNRRKIKNLTQQDFEEVLHLPQREASQKLDVCISTLKRQFRKLFPQRRWPTPSERKLEFKKHKSKQLRSRLKQIVSLNDDFLTGSTFSHPHSFTTHNQTQPYRRKQQFCFKRNQSEYPDRSSFPDEKSDSTSPQSDTFTPPAQERSMAVWDSSLHGPVEHSYPSHISYNGSVSAIQQQQNQQKNYHYTLLARLLQENCSLHDLLKKRRSFVQSLVSQLQVPKIKLPGSQFQGDIFDIPGPWDTDPFIRDSKNTAALFLVDEWLNVVAVSQGLCRMLGYSFQDFAPTTHYAIFVSKLFKPEYFALLAKRVLESDLSDIVFTDTFLRKDKTMIRVTQNIHKIGKRFFWVLVEPATSSNSFLKLNEKEAYSNQVEYKPHELSEADAAAEHMNAIRGISKQVALNPTSGAFQDSPLS